MLYFSGFVGSVSFGSSCSGLAQFLGNEQIGKTHISKNFYLIYAQN